MKTKLMIEMYGHDEEVRFPYSCGFKKEIDMPFFLRTGDKIGVDDSCEENTFLVNHPEFTVRDSNFNLLTMTAEVWFDEIRHEFLTSDSEKKEFIRWMKDVRGWEKLD